MTTRLNSREDLLSLYGDLKHLADEKLEILHSKRKIISVCSCTGCASQDSLLIVEELNKHIQERHMEDTIEATITGCFGFCARGPIVKIYPDEIFYVQVKKEDAGRIIDAIVHDTVVEDLLYKLDHHDHAKHQNDIPFYGKQHRIALHKAGLINPESFEDCIATKGYQALAKALYEMSRDDVIEEVTRSGLRGRGGAGFPTGKKWSFAKASYADKKYIICNADEGDPGAFMDRSILEGDPHSVLEAMAIAGYAIGADEGEIYIRAEYPLAIKRLRMAITEAEE